MEFLKDETFALQLDKRFYKTTFKEEFIIPKKNKKEVIYLCGNSLGLQPKKIKLM